MTDPWAIDGRLKANGQTGWRRCSTCRQWIIAARVDGLLVKLNPSGIKSRMEALKIMESNVAIYTITPHRSAVWINPARLARRMLNDPDLIVKTPVALYREHEHVRSGVLDPHAGEDWASRGSTGHVRASGPHDPHDPTHSDSEGRSVPASEYPF